LDSASLRAYLLQNLVKSEGRWQWRINLQGLSAGIEDIMLFPSSSSEFEKPALFLKGEESDYINENNELVLLNYFPLAQIEVIAETGHWLYAERPDAFIQAMANFLPRYEPDE
jgi:esterase